MKLKSIFTAILLGLCIISVPQDIYGQKKSSHRSGKTTTTKKSVTSSQKSALTKADLQGKDYLGWADVSMQGARMATNVQFESDKLIYYFASNKKNDSDWTIADNEVSFKMAGYPVNLSSKNKGETLEGTCLMGNKKLPVKLYSLGNKGVYDKKSLLEKIESSKYTASMDGTGQDVILNMPANFKLINDEEDPEEMSYKVSGDVEIYTYIGTMKGEISFEENEIKYTGVDGKEYSLPYNAINENVMKLPLGSKNIPNFGKMDFTVYLYF